MKRIVFHLAINLILVGMIGFVAIAWADLSHRNVYEGPLLFTLWSTHGVHVFDVLVLGIELVLIALLVIAMTVSMMSSRQR